MMASRSSSVKRSLLFRATINRLPLSCELEDGLAIGPGQVVVDDKDQQIGAGGQVDRFELSVITIWPGLAKPRRIRQQQRPFHPLDHVGVRLAAAGGPHVAPVSPAVRPRSALTSEVFPTGPVPSTTN